MLRIDEDCPPDELIDRLAGVGYVHEEPLNNVGQFSVRGGILDVWPANADQPVRIEFFGDTVDSIRQFDPETQLSIKKVSEVAVPPMREFSLSPQDFKDWAFFARERFSDERVARNLRDRTDFAEEGESFSGWEFLMPLIRPKDASAFDYFGDSILVFDEPVVIEHHLTSLYKQFDRRFHELSELEDIGLEPKELFMDGGELRKHLDPRRRLEMRGLGKAVSKTDEEFAVSGNDPGSPSTEAPLFLFPTAERSEEIEIQSRSTRKFHGDIQRFAEELKDAGHQASHRQTVFVVESAGIAERLSEIFREYDVSDAGLSIVGSLSSGFEIPSLRITVYSEADIFGDITLTEQHAAVKRTSRTKSNLGAFISDFRDLKPGDFVVHVDHGIGRFEGLQTLDTGGISREFMMLMYADNAKLFVPVERLDLVSRYSSGEATSPTLDRLGGIGWQKTKAKAKRAMRDMADELLKLYAERKLVRGYAFSPDAPWQHEFEDAFPFELTARSGRCDRRCKGRYGNTGADGPANNRRCRLW